MPLSNYTTTPRPPSCRFISWGKIFIVSPLGLFVECKDEYEKAHSLYAYTQGGAKILRFGGDAHSVKTVDRIAEYRAKRDKLEGVL